MVAVGVLGLVLMAVAALWAPAQPELLTSGGSCEVAPCGSLEDPSRWRAAWWPWAVGALASAVAVALLPSRWRVRPWHAVVALVALPLGLAALAVVAVVVSWTTSVHGAATVGWLGVGLPLVSAAASAVRSLRDRGRPPVTPPHPPRPTSGIPGASTSSRTVDG